MNEAAAKYIAFKEPIGQWMTWNGKPYHVIGVIRDMVVESPYETVRPFLFNLSGEAGNVVVIKLNTARSLTESMALLESVFKKHNPAAPFEYKFVDQEYARKFSDEERIGTLASVFAGLAIFISCLGIFGLASFMAEQRTKEIGLRKVMGASIMNLWGMLSKDFVFLVIISILLATPFSYYWMNQWLQKYEYRTEIVWWVFVFSALGALVITLGTVSYQSVKAAMANPVNSLRSE